MEKMHWEHVKILEDMKSLYIRYLQDFSIGREDRVPSYWKFQTDGIFYNNSQDEIYQSVMSGVLDNVVDGCDAVILAYGQTGSGKTLTINGLVNSFKDRGIAPRVISDLFQKRESLKDQCKICIQMSYIETNQLYINDLLSPNLSDLHDVKHIKIMKMEDECAAMRTLFIAEGRRQFAKDFSNSHAANGVLTLHVSSKSLNHAESLKKTAKIHIVDLAGVDAYGHFTSLHKNLFQLSNANLAKSHLEQFLLILGENVPERTLAKQRLNILIHYLGKSLSARSVLRFIGHLRVDRENLLLTISMLRFGQIVRGLIPQKLQPNVSENEDVKNELLQQELVELQKERDLDVMLTNGDLSTNITQERLKHMRHIAEDYLQDKTNEVVLLSVTDANTVLKVFKELFNKLEAEKIACAKEAYEKAYEDILEGVKVVPSKTDSFRSAKSFRKLSRRSVKSKELSSSPPTLGSAVPSLMKTSPKKSSSVKSASPASSKLSETIKPSAQSLSKNKSLNQQSNQSKLLKRTKTSSISMTKKSSASRRRSNSSTPTQNTAAAELIEEVPLPDALPPHNEAWSLFTNDGLYDYKKLNDIAGVCEDNAREAHISYLKEVNDLRKFMDMVDLRKNELQKAQMQRLLIRAKCDDEDDVVISELERVCLDNLKKAQGELVENQEKVLKAQTELRLALDSSRNAKQAISNQYERFCYEKYQTLIPDLGVTSSQAMDEGTQIDHSEQNDPKSIVAARVRENAIARYDSLKQLMTEQMQKKIYTRDKNKKWVRSCKT